MRAGPRVIARRLSTDGARWDGPAGRRLFLGRAAHLPQPDLAQGIDVMRVSVNDDSTISDRTIDLAEALIDLHPVKAVLFAIGITIHRLSQQFGQLGQTRFAVWFARLNPGTKRQI